MIAPNQHVPGERPEGRPEARDARLRKHGDYQRVYKAARKQPGSAMTWFFADRVASGSIAPNETPRVGLTVGKVLGKAHERNRIKRRMRAAVRMHLSVLPAGVDVILHPRRQVMTLEFGKLEGEVLRIFRQAAAQARQIALSRAGATPLPEQAR